MQRNPALVVHVLYRFAVGGLENGVVNLINRLPPERWRHAVIALDGVDERFAARVRRSDVEYIALEKGRGHLLRHYPRLAALFRRLAPAIVHTRNLAALEAAVPAWWAGVPVRIHGEHGWDVHDAVGDNVRYQHLRRLYMPFVHHYVALSGDLAGYLERKVGIPRGRITPICNGVDVARFAPSSPHAQREAAPGMPFDRSHWLVGTVGRLAEVKDQCNLVRAFAMAVKRSPEAARRMRLVIVGEGPLRPAVEAILREADVAHLAWLAGARDDVPRLLQALDCFALPSQTEGISNTILEAMACGRCIVATRVGGNAELVQDGVSGTLVPARDADALCDAILRYFSDPALCAAHAAAARAKAVREFSLERMVAQYEALYLAMLTARRVGSSSGITATNPPQL
jgi:sugar transferase (PEP-CTERM/EpsH1 system associated)